MANEVELKLTLPSVAVPNFLQDSLLGDKHGDPLILDNQYFDTPDMLLNMSHAALRIRKSQHGFKQTLKNKGSAIAGLHVRGEWEYDISSSKLDWSLFPEDVQIESHIQQAIQPIFKTDFKRHVWNISFGNSQIELVLDEGLVSANHKNISLCEIELELKSGDVADLFTFAISLAQRHPLVPCDISKAERGYRLLKPGLSFFDPSDFAEQFKQQQDFSVKQLMEETLQNISRRWDDVCNSESWWSLLVISRQVQGLSWMVNQLPMVPESIQSNLQVLANDLIELLEPASVVIALHVDDHSNSKGLSQRLLDQHGSALIAAMQAFIKQNRLGQSMLDLGQCLYLLEAKEPSQKLSFKEYLLSSLYNLQVSQWQEKTDQQVQALQGLAYMFKSIGHDAYPVLNEFINQYLVVDAMGKAQQMLHTISDEDSRAKLGSWVRRLTVASRVLQDARKNLLKELHKI